MERLFNVCLLEVPKKGGMHNLGKIEGEEDFSFTQFFIFSEFVIYFSFSTLPPNFKGFKNCDRIKDFEHAICSH